MGDATLQAEFRQWLQSHSAFGSTAWVVGEEALDRSIADPAQLWDRVALFDVLASRSPFDLLLDIDGHLAEACEIVIAAPVVQRGQSTDGTPDWKRGMFSMAQRFGFSEADTAMQAAVNFAYVHLRRSKRPPFRLGKITAANAPEMRELFHRIFGHPMSEAFWRWKYAEGKSRAMGLWQDDQLIAHYGGLAEDIVLDGKQVKAMQMVDVMVDPKVRHAARRQSPFFILTSAFTECFVGWQSSYLLAFGFPSHRHLQLAEHLKLYAPVGQMNEVIFSDRKATFMSELMLQWQLVTTANFASVAAELDVLWQKMHAAMPNTTCVEKNAARIQRRYLSHPEIAYRIHLVRKRWSNEALCVVVLKEQADKILLMDIVGSPDSFQPVLRSAKGRLQKQHNKALTAWISNTFTAAIAAATDQINALPISIPTITWTEGPKPEHLKDRWWLTAGDTDFL